MIGAKFFQINRTLLQIANAQIKIPLFVFLCNRVAVKGLFMVVKL